MAFSADNNAPVFPALAWASGDGGDLWVWASAAEASRLVARTSNKADPKPPKADPTDADPADLQEAIETKFMILMIEPGWGERTTLSC